MDQITAVRKSQFYDGCHTKNYQAEGFGHCRDVRLPKSYSIGASQIFKGFFQRLNVLLCVALNRIRCPAFLLK